MAGEPPTPLPTADQLDHLALALVPGLGPRLTASLLTAFGTAHAIRRAKYQQLINVPKIGEKLARSFVDAFQTIDAEREYHALQQRGIQFAILGEANYPSRLSTIPDAPTVLFYQGNYEPADLNAVGLVGSRNCTNYGMRTTEKLASALARAGWTVISGLARGIDGVAHRAALEAGGRTLAILAGGLGKIYPPEHSELAREIIPHGGLFTETPLGVSPQPGMFPARNRIISGLSRGIVVIEANTKSGALITVDHALEQGREIFAIPGQIDSPTSAGCLELIRNGAKLIRDADDLLEDLRGIHPPDASPQPRPRRIPTLFEVRPPEASRQPSSVPAAPPPAPVAILDPIAQRIWDALSQSRQVDEICRLTELPMGEVLKTVTLMELKKQIRRLPGNHYERR